MHAITHFFLHTNPLLIYLIVLIVLALESSAVPIANNTLLLLTGALASMGRCDIWTLGAMALAGSIAGACLAYTIGAKGGRTLFVRLGRVMHISPEKVDVVERWFRRSGIWMVFFSRMTPYVRPFACFPAGFAGMRFPQFFVGAASGSLIWCTALLTLGWHLGKRWELAMHLMQDYTVPTLGALALLLVLYYVVVRAIKKKLTSRLRPPFVEGKKERGRITRKLQEV